MIKIWIDDERPAPEDDDNYYHYKFKSVNETLLKLGFIIKDMQVFDKTGTTYLLDLDHDAGEYADDGGDYINILKALSQPWIKDLLCFTEDDLNEHYRGQPWTKDYLDAIKVHFHSANPVGVKNMRAIVKNCPWMEEA